MGNDKMLFLCKIENAWDFKCAIDILNRVKSSYTLVINHKEKVINLREINEVEDLVVDMVLKNFSYFKYNGKEPFYIGLFGKTVWDIIKSIKKKDVLELYIPKEKNEMNKHLLYFSISNKDQGRSSEQAVVINEFPQKKIELDTDKTDGSDYLDKNSYPSNEFRTICKNIKKMENIEILVQGNSIKFTGKSEIFPYGCITLGRWENDSPVIYQANFKPSQLQKLSKFSSFNTPRIIVKIKENAPIIFCINDHSLDFSIHINEKGDEDKD